MTAAEQSVQPEPRAARSLKSMSVSRGPLPTPFCPTIQGDFYAPRNRNSIYMPIGCCLHCTGARSTKELGRIFETSMHIGVVSYTPDSDRITIEIYTEQDHAIAIDSRNLSLEQLSSKYERVAKELERTRRDILTSLKSKTEEIPHGKEYGEPEISLRTNPREAFYKIASTGDDYILVINATSPTKRRVLATRFIPRSIGETN